MTEILKSLALSLLSRLDIGQAVDVITRFVIGLLPEKLLVRIDDLVRQVDDLDLPGEDKFKEVVRMLKDPESGVRKYLDALPMQFILWAIDSAYKRYAGK